MGKLLKDNAAVYEENIEGKKSNNNVLGVYIGVKRAIDLTLSLIALIVLSPVLLLIGIIVKIDSKGPVIFKQKRIGKNKKEFYILKYRTMISHTPENVPTHLLKNADWFITRVGKVLRRTSLDELPQLINIIKGEMSIIGPRPALWNQYDLIAERDKYGANDITPGLTGWAQINGRDTVTIEDKAAYDGDYVRKLGFSMDLKIFFKTVLLVIRRVGVVEGKQESNNDVRDMDGNKVSV